MTQEQFLARIKGLTIDLRADIEKEALRLFNSGAVDTGEYVDDFFLPKIIISVALENEAKQWQPLSFTRKEWEELNNNLRKF
jgi:hypothetical protein